KKMVILLFNYRFLINSFLILLRTKFFIQFLIDTIESVNLYDNRSNVITLIDNNFFSNILNKDYLIVCNYYKHWSPECQRFSYLFRNFSEITRPWNQALRLISVNCAENLVCNRALKNSDVLDDVEASNFPIIQFIEPKTKEITKILESLNSSQSMIYNRSQFRKLSAMNFFGKNSLCNQSQTSKQSMMFVRF
ncbi:hypothetical protein SSS_09999, partial [Sarcoptes scabiei]